MKKVNFLTVVLVLFAISGCYRVPSVKGPEYNLYVFAENSDYASLKEILHATFEREILTPQYETHFKIIHVKPADFGNYLTYKQLLFVATLQSEGSIADLVKRSITQQNMMEKVENGESFLFKNEDQWIKDQLIITLVAPTLDSLMSKIDKNKDFIYNYFYDFQQKTVFDYVYSRLENKKLPKELMEKFQWTVRVPHDYFIDSEDPENNFVLLRRRIPERWFMVKYFDGLQPDIISEKWALDLRDSLGVRYFSGIKTNREYCSSKEINFLGRRCLRVQGLWEHDEQVVGGPFISYVFYDEGMQRVYLLDCATFAPNRDKIPFLDQMDAMVHTFKTKLEIQREEAK